MHPPTTAELLDVWEAGVQQSLPEKSLHLLRVAWSVADLSRVAAMSIGERDAGLLLLREWLFGPRLVNKAACPACAEVVEWEATTHGLRLQPPTIAEPPRVFDLMKEDFTVRFRLPNSYDLRRNAAELADQTTPRRLLLGCILSAQRHEQPCAVEELPPAVLDALSERMAQEDPQADIQMLVSCPSCGQQWQTPFDIASYLWLEIDSWARHLLQEVYVLARTFGWAEHDILHMSPQRRQLYLDLIRT
jgi:hypothetical protein